MLNKRVIRQFLTAALLLVTAGAMAAEPVSIHQGADGSFNITFPEPVVSLSTVQEGDTTDPKAEGRRMLVISGDGEREPATFWRDQDTLAVRPPENAYAGTTYRVRLKPGTTYLSGREADVEIPELRVPDISWAVRQRVMLPQGFAAVLDCSHNCLFVPRKKLTPELGLRFFFQEEHYMEVKGLTQSPLRRVSAHTEPVYLKHGVSAELLAHLTERACGADVEQLTEDTPLPHCVLVVPDEPLPANTLWRLGCEGGYGYAADDCIMQEEAEPYLCAALEQGRDKESAGKTLLALRFNAPVRQADLPAFFRTMALRVGDPSAAPDAELTATAGDAEEKDGVLTRTLTYKGKVIRFVFDPALREPEEETPALPVYRNSGNGSREQWSYENPATTEMMLMRVETEEPCTVEAELPQGSLTSALGLAFEKTLRHRVTLGVLRPTVTTIGGSAPDRCVTVSRHGDRTLELHTDSCARLEVSTYRWNAAAAAEHLELFRRLAHHHFPDLSLYEAALSDARARAGLEPHKAEAVKNLRKQMRGYSPERAALQALLASGENVGTRSLPVDAAGRYATATLPLSMDELAGGTAAPGVYVLRLRLIPTAEVVALAQSVGLTAEDVTKEQMVFVNVTGLCARAEENVVLVCRTADGLMPEEGRVHRVGESIALKQGYAAIPDAPRERSELMVIEAGDDVLLQEYSPGCRLREEETSDKVQLLSDRALYRPGETVHLFGLQRRVEGQHSRTLTAPLELTVQAPGGNKLAVQTVQPDAYGSFAVSFELPDGEEDVTGFYRFSLRPKQGPRQTLGSHAVRSEVFRRDSFDIKTSCEMKPVCPDRYRCMVTARDYNGTPLAGAKVELELTSDACLGSAEGDVLRTTLTTDADGSASYECPLAVIPPKGEETPDTPVVYVMASVSVSNDREEVRHAVMQTRGAFADFELHREDDRLRLCRFTAEGNEPPLEYEQTLHGVLTGERMEKTVFPNGMVRRTPKRETLWEGDVRFPANDSVGVKQPFDLSSVFEHHQDVKVVWTGRDAAGHDFRRTMPLYSWSASREDEPKERVELRDEEGALIATSTRAGQGYALVQGAQGTTLYPVRVEQGEHPLQLPEGALPAGDCQVELGLPYPDAKGEYTAVAGGRTSIYRRDVARTLNVTTELSAETVAPGGELTVQGRVTRAADGAALKARVLLFAVDEGMLSVSGGKTLPDWQRAFSLGSRYYGTRHWGRDEARWAFEHRSSEWAGLWQGEWTADGRWKSAELRGGIVEVGYGLAADDRSNGAMKRKTAAPMVNASKAMVAEDAAPAPVQACMAGGADEAEAAEGGAPEPAVRRNFTPVAVWSAATESDAEGRFSCTFRVPDTLTRYRLFCTAADAEGDRFGNADTSFEVRQPVMLTAGTPLFMSTGDRLLLPLTLTNATDKDDTWQVQLSTGETQSIRLAAQQTGTLYFAVSPQEEGEMTLRWTARAAAGSDAVEGSFPVRFPAPLLKENHHLVLAAEGQGTLPSLSPAALLAPELAESERGELTLELSANPLLHLAGFADFVLGYPYGCTEQVSTGLLPWLMYDRLAPFCPQMAETPAAEVHTHLTDSIRKMFKRQQSDGGLSYWEGGRESCLWASAHAALILTYAAEQSYAVPQDKMDKLRDYLRAEKDKAVKEKRYSHWGALMRYEVARVLGDKDALLAALREAVQPPAEQDAQPRPFYCCLPARIREDARLLLALHGTPDGHHAAFLTWMRSRGRDYRHPSTWTGAWTLIALREYLGAQPAGDTKATVLLADGRTMELGNGVTRLTLAARGQKLGAVSDSFAAAQGTTYVNVVAKAKPARTEYPGITEKGLQVTRLYEKKNAEGKWQPATEFNVGDVVRVTLTCAKVAPELEYLVLEDSLPSCMEAVNPAIRSQAAGIDFVPWSAAFDNKEFLADRVRGFCTRWGGRNLLNMVYFARVKRAGVSVAPPAQAQLMYEPQTHGLSPNAVIISK